MSMGSRGPSQPLPHSLVPSILWGPIERDQLGQPTPIAQVCKLRPQEGAGQAFREATDSSGWLMFIGFGKPKPGPACDIQCPSSLG